MVGVKPRPATTRGDLPAAVVAGATTAALEGTEHMDGTGGGAIEAALRNDPAGVFDLCDQATRASYTHAVTELARQTGMPAADVAAAAVTLCQEHPGDPRASHVGWALLGEGRRQLEAVLGYRPPTWLRMLRSLVPFRVALYIGAMVCWSAAVVGSVIAYREHLSQPGGILLALLLLPLAVSMGRTVVRALIEALCPPRERLPRLHFPDGMHEEFRTCVISPVIIHDTADIETVIGNMERNHRGNHDQNILYVLLADLPDASTQWEDSDRTTIEQAERAVATLNSDLERPVFHVLFRRREWNAGEGVWMGWERKRGKIEEFNRVVLGEPQATTFLLDDELAAELRSVTFVVTLDADIRMQRHGVRRLAGTLAHPLNRPVLSADGRTVTAGHGVLRPGIDFTSAGPPTAFRLLAFGRPSAVYDMSHQHVAAGIRPSAHQDCFGEDVFIGQGIYDVRAFAATLAGRIPENSVLSHDKLEGMHARAGYVSDTVYLECPPNDYLEYRRRHHRWVRGDFHLIPWLFTRGSGRRAALSALARWNLFSDLMEHLRYPAAALLLCLGWIGGDAVLLTLAVLVTLNASIATRALVTLVGRDRTPPSHIAPRPRGSTWDRVRARVAAALWAARGEGKRRALWMVFLLDSGLSNADAACRSLYRTVVSRRHILQWTTAAKDSRRLAHGDLRSRWRSMAVGPVLSLVIAAAVLATHPDHLVIAAPFLLAWCLAPQVAHAMGPQPAGNLPSPRTPAARDNLAGRHKTLMEQRTEGPQR